MADYYVVLGLPETATAEEVKEAYRRLARAYHPDVSGADTAGQFCKVQEAWEVLGDAARRRAYDAGRQPPSRPKGVRGGTFGDRPPAWGGAGRDPVASEAGRTLDLELHVSPGEAHRGCVVPLELPAVGPCPACGGFGRSVWAACPACRGRGYGLTVASFHFHVPAGVEDGEMLEVPLDRPDLLHGRLLIRVRIMRGGSW